ncbi:MAG: amidohydrolase [Actinomycetota bacterium]
MRTLYRASRVVTLSHPTTGDWILVDDRHVQRVGTGDPPEAELTIDLPGTTIVPGFIDSHVHLTGTGRALANEDVREAASKEELLALILARAGEGTAPVHVEGFDETRWERSELPTAADLDEITDAPVVATRADGHISVVSTSTLSAIDLADAEGIELDTERRPTGRLTKEANHRAVAWIEASYDRRRIEGFQLQAAGLAASRGVTAVHEMSLDVADLEVLIGHRRRLPLDVSPIPASMSLPEAMDRGFAAIGGDLPVDGSLGARTAALSHPYDDGPEEGELYHDDDAMAEFFHAAHNAGLQVGVHAIGDRAIEQVVATWERVYVALDSRERRHFRARRHRIEHFVLPSADQIERTAMLGLAVSVQPAFDRLWGQGGGLYEARLGPARAMAAHPIRTMLDRGIEVGVGSDSPVTPLDPMLAIAALEGLHEPSERLTRLEALKLHRVGSARLGRQDAKKGALEPGRHADFAAYEEDPLEVASPEGLRPVLTVSLGREVFRA